MVEAVLLNIFAQAIWELGICPLFKGSEAESDDHSEADRNPSRYENAVASALGVIENQTNLDANEPALSEFLESPPIRSLVKSLYIFRLEHDNYGTDEARQDFAALWDATEFPSAEGDQVFRALVGGAEEALAAAIQDGVLAAHEARSDLRHKIVVEHLEALERRTRLLSGDAPIDQSQVLAFEEELRREVLSHHSHITPPDFSSAPRIPIDDLYVPPNLRDSHRITSDEDVPLNLQTWLSGLSAGVVLGDPGGGKSTLATKVCHALASASPWQVAGLSRTPVMVTLREYNMVSKDRGLSIVEYVEELASTRYQLTVPPEAVSYLLLCGRLMIIFDGLDELLEAHQRRVVRDSVESFQRRFPDTPLIITSRAVGYDQAPLNHEVFSTVKLAEFSDQQVEEYTYKWFALDEDLSEEESKSKANSFVEESRAVPDLRVNPLLLALMCNFYRNQNYLPRNFPEVYEACARMLFETWDRSRGIDAVLPFEQHIRPAMRYLAHWIYGAEDLQSGVREAELVAKAAESLGTYRFRDPHEAQPAAESFIRFCSGRAWVFTDTGSTADGEPLFQFTHRTFLEYFTADHLVATSDSTSDLCAHLVPRIVEREWWVVALVAFQIRSRQHLEAANDLLGHLVDQAEASGAGRTRASLLLFACECLAFIVPSPSIINRVARASTELLTERVVRTVTDETFPDVPELTDALMRAGIETREEVASAAIEFIETTIHADDSIRASSAALALDGVRMSMSGPEAFVAWGEQLENARGRTKDARIELARNDSALALSMCDANEVDIAEAVQWHGTRPLFRKRAVPFHPGAFFTPLVNRMVSAAAWPNESSRHFEAMLEDLGGVISSTPRPWQTLGDGFSLRADLQHHGGQTARTDELTGDALFAFIAIFAACAEEELANTDRDGESNAELISGLVRPLNKPLQEIVESFLVERLEAQHLTGDHFAGTPVSNEQLALLAEWCSSEVDFVGPRSEQEEIPGSGQSI